MSKYRYFVAYSRVKDNGDLAGIQSKLVDREGPIETDEDFRDLEDELRVLWFASTEVVITSLSKLRGSD